MKVEFLIDQEGNVVTEVVDRQGENCSGAVKLAQGLGTITSDEQTGPECDEVHEGMADGEKVI